MPLPIVSSVSAVADEERGRQIKERREFLGLTQADLAGRVGAVEQTVRNIERGQNSPKYLPRILAELDKLERSPHPRTATEPPSDSPMRQMLNAVVGDDEVYELRVRMIKGVRVVEFLATNRSTSQDELEAVIAEIRRPPTQRS